MAGKILYPGAKSQHKSFVVRFKKIIIALVAILILAIFYMLVQYSAYWLVKNDDFKHVKYAIVLDGQGAEMQRSDYALKLMSQNKIDTIIVSGSKRFKRLNSSELARTEMLSQGDYNPNRILTIHHREHSTLFEAKTIIPYLKARKVDSVLIITSSMAAARANHIFTTLSGDKIKYLSTNLDYADFIKPENWTTSRIGKKIWLKEMIKRIYTYWELLGEEEVQVQKKRKYILNHDINNKKDIKSLLVPIVPDTNSYIEMNDLNEIDVDTVDLDDSNDSLINKNSDSLKTDSVELKDSLDVKKDSIKSKKDSNVSSSNDEQPQK